MSDRFKLNRRSLMLGASVTAGAYVAACAKTTTATAQDSVDLSGVSILITGCSSGFGRLGAEHYARLGAKVFATMRNLPRPEATELEALAKSDKLDITVLEIDITDDAQVKSGVAVALDASSGKLTSQLGRVIIPGFGQYSPTKFALEAMSEQMAYEVASHGIDVTIIQPGGYPTRIWYNQNAPSAALKARLSDDVINAYPAFTAGMGKREAGGGESDPMDIPRAIADAIAKPQGTRPLRIALHPKARPQEIVNKASVQAQLTVLGNSPLGPIVKGVLD